MTDAPVRIRPVEPRDYEPIARITNTYIRETTVHFGYHEIDAEHVRRAHEEAGEAFPWLAAARLRDTFGYAKAGVWRARDAYRATCETTVYVDPAHQGRGLGRLLMTELLAELRRRGFHLAVAGATMPNDASVRLHESLGFRRVGTFPECGRKFDAWHDVAFFALLLEDR